MGTRACSFRLPPPRLSSFPFFFLSFIFPAPSPSPFAYLPQPSSISTCGSCPPQALRPPGGPGWAPASPPNSPHPRPHPCKSNSSCSLCLARGDGWLLHAIHFISLFSGHSLMDGEGGNRWIFGGEHTCCQLSLLIPRSRGLVLALSLLNRP